MEFTRLERDVLDWISSHSSDHALQEQLKYVESVSREFTGVGSFTKLKVHQDSPRVQFRVRPLEPLIESPEIQDGAGVVLHFENGRTSLLELYTLGGTTFPTDLREWQLT